MKFLFLFLEALAQSMSIMGVCILVPALVVMLMQEPTTFIVSGALFGVLHLMVAFLLFKKLETLTRTSVDTCK